MDEREGREGDGGGEERRAGASKREERGGRYLNISDITFVANN